MLNIVIALKTWGRWWLHSAIAVVCDNLGVVQVVNTGKTKDTFLGLCVNNIWILIASFDTQLQIHHIAGTYNVIVDTLSRVYSDKPVNLNLLNILPDNYIWDNILAHYFDLNMQHYNEQRRLIDQLLKVLM